MPMCDADHIPIFWNGVGGCPLCVAIDNYNEAITDKEYYFDQVLTLEDSLEGAEYDARYLQDNLDEARYQLDLANDEVHTLETEIEDLKDEIADLRSGEQRVTL